MTESPQPHDGSAPDSTAARDDAAAPTNPYAAPATGPVNGGDDSQEADPLQRRRRRWLKMLAVNAIVPLMIGGGVVQDSGGWGMPLGLFFAGIIGWYACRSWPGGMTQICRGAPYVAVLQLLPLPHVIVGLGLMVLFDLPVADHVGIAAVTLSMTAVFTALAYFVGGLVAADQ